MASHIDAFYSYTFVQKSICFTLKYYIYVHKLRDDEDAAGIERTFDFSSMHIAEVYTDW